MFRKHARKVASFLGMAFMLALFLPKLALADDDDDPPSRVARLAYAQGSVSFQPGGTDDWVTAVVNRPITTGDKLWSDNDGRVELQLDGSIMRLSNNTGFSFLNLSDNVTQIRLTEGNLFIRVRRMDQDETYEVDTPNLAFSITKAGTYRLTVNEGGDSTIIKVRDGEGEVTGGGTSYSVRSNDDATFSGTDQLNADVQDYGRDNDDFDSWSTTRDSREQKSNSAQYVSDDVVGYEDLDDNGSWRDEPEYGHIWYPRVTVTDWAPYHYGHWAYIEPWGYTWVDDAPWGFAPFHYGRWVSVRGQWGWIPAPRRVVGVVYVRPVYAPALVAFVGGANFSIGVSIGGGGGSVGWFPLGPREVYVPSYRTSRRYVDRVNISNTTVNTTVVNNYYNTTVINNNNRNTRVSNVTYVNQRVPGAVMATSQQAFTSAQPVSRNAVKFDQRQLATAQVQVRQPTIVPTRQAVLGTGRAAAARPPAALQTRAVVAKAAPPPPPPSFEKRQEAIKSNGGRPLSVAQIRQIQPAQAQRQAPVRVAPPAKQPAAPIARQANRPGQPPPNGQQPGVQPRNAQQPTEGNVGNRPGQPPTGQPQNTNPANRPGVAPNTVSPNRPGQPQPNQPVPPNAAQPQNRPVTPPNAAQPGNRPNDRPGTPPNPVQPGNRPGDRPVIQPNTVQPGNRPNDRPVTPPNAAQPGNRPADRPVTQPNTTQPENRPADRRPNTVQPPNRNDRPAARPNEQPTAPPVPAARPTERPAAERPTPAARPIEQPAPRPAERPAVRPTERPVPDRPAPAARPAERPAPERPAPAVRPAERPAPERPAPAARPQQRQQERANDKPPKEKDKDKDKEKPPKG